MLVQMRVMDFPHMKKSDKTRLHREMHKLAYPKTHEPVAEMSSAEVAERIRKAIGRG